MKKYLYCLSLLSILSLSSCVNAEIPANDEENYKPVSYQTLNVSLCDEEVEKYLMATTETEQFKILYNHEKFYQNSPKDKPNLPVVTFNESVNLPFTFAYTEDNWTTVNYANTNTNSYVFNAPIPGHAYQWEAVDAKNTLLGHGVVNVSNATGVRYMNIEGAINARDEGGWIGEDGHMVQYGLLYRGGQLNGNNTLTKKGLSFIRDVMGIKTEVDFRNNNDDAGQKVTAIGEKTFGGYDVRYIRDLENEFQSYDGFYKNITTRKMIKTTLEAMSEIENYPLYFHCIGGADRTGSFGFLVNGLLGVSEEDLIKDYELTSFSSYGPRWRAGSNNANTGFDYSKIKDSYDFQLMIKTLRTYGNNGDSIQQCIVNFLTKANDSSKTGGCGLSIETLNKIKVILLGLERDYLDSRNVNETCDNSGVAVYHLSNKDMVINTSKLNHDYTVNEGFARCSRCKKVITAVSLDVDVKSGYDFGNDKISATFTNGMTLSLKDGHATFDPSFAYDKKVGLIVTDKNQNNTYYDLTIYSSFIANENDLLNMNQYEYIMSSCNGEKTSCGYYKQLNDIILSSNWGKSNALGLLADKSSNGGFNGLYDGNNHQISNFNCVGQDSALIYNMGKDGEIKNLTVSGKSLDAYFGSDFISAYTYGGKFTNLVINVSLGNGDMIYNNTALLGTIAFNDDLSNDIFIDNVTLNCSNENEGYSTALGQIYFSSQREGKIDNHLKLKDVKIHSFKNFLIFGNTKTSLYEAVKTKSDLMSVIGEGNIANLVVD